MVGALRGDELEPTHRCCCAAKYADIFFSGTRYLGPCRRDQRATAPTRRVRGPSGSAQGPMAGLARCPRSWRTHLPSRLSCRLSSRATLETGRPPSITRRAASILNSGANDRRVRDMSTSFQLDTVPLSQVSTGTGERHRYPGLKPRSARILRSVAGSARRNLWRVGRVAPLMLMVA